MQQTFDEISHIKVDNIMHAATIQRAADTHTPSEQTVNYKDSGRKHL